MKKIFPLSPAMLAVVCLALTLLPAFSARCSTDGGEESSSGQLTAAVGSALSRDQEYYNARAKALSELGNASTLAGLVESGACKKTATHSKSRGGTRVNNICALRCEQANERLSNAISLLAPFQEIGLDTLTSTKLEDVTQRVAACGKEVDESDTAKTKIQEMLNRSISLSQQGRTCGTASKLIEEAETLMQQYSVQDEKTATLHATAVETVATCQSLKTSSSTSSSVSKTASTYRSPCGVATSTAATKAPTDGVALCSSGFKLLDSVTTVIANGNAYYQWKCKDIGSEQVGLCTTNIVKYAQCGFGGRVWNSTKQPPDLCNLGEPVSVQMFPASSSTNNQIVWKWACLGETGEGKSVLAPCGTAYNN